MERAYTSAGVDRYAVWAHESDQGMQAELAARGYKIDISTRAMGMSLDNLPVAVPDAGIERLEDWDEYLEYLWSVGAPGRTAERGRPKRLPRPRGADRR